MAEHQGLLILLIGLLADYKWGEPDFLWKRLPHPVVLFGKAVSFVDRQFNASEDEDDLRLRKGAISISALIFAAIVAGLGLSWLFNKLSIVGIILECLIVFMLLAQKSLTDHVGAVASGLRDGGLEGGRKAVSMIVGRDPASLDRRSVVRAAIESLAENFSDGVVAPVFWYAIFGLPGLFAYKMINTADSMIGYHSARHEYFGKAAARIDDLANWLPARLSALLIAAGTLVLKGPRAARNALTTAFRDAGLHRSPNAGWPEAAMAGAAGFALGGPRVYPAETVQQAFLNGAGRHDLDAGDIDLAISIERSGFAVLCIMVGLALIVT